MPAARDFRLVRPDGRRVSWREAGREQDGRTLVHFHGYPGSRLEIDLADRLARDLGLTMVALERPGFGRSSRHPGRTLLDWPDDVAAVLDQRGDERALITGASGGAPYALAFAHAYPARVERVGLMGGLGPLAHDDALLDDMVALNRLGIRAWQRHRGLAAPCVRALMEIAARLPAWAWATLLRLSPPEPDRRALRQGLARELATSFAEGVHAGGMLDELDLIVSPWPFELERVEAPVHMWHGQLDTIVPPAVARHLASRLPDARLTWFAEEGHFSLIAKRMPEMLSALCREANAPEPLA